MDTAGFAQQTDIGDDHIFLNGFAHIIDRQSGSGHAWSKIKNLCQSATEKNIVFILDTNITKLDANEKTVWNYYMNMLTERGKNVFVVSPGIKTSAEPSGGVFYLFLGAPGQSSVNSVFYDLNQAKPLRFTFLGDEIKYTFQS